MVWWKLGSRACNGYCKLLKQTNTTHVTEEVSNEEMIQSTSVLKLTFSVHSEDGWGSSASAIYTDMSSHSSKNSAWQVVRYSSHFPYISIILACK